MPVYTPPEIHISEIMSEGLLASSLEKPVEGEVIPW